MLPPLPEHVAAATVLFEMSTQLPSLEQQQKKTRALKQGMMQVILIGERDYCYDDGLRWTS